MAERSFLGTWVALLKEVKRSRERHIAAAPWGYAAKLRGIFNATTWLILEGPNTGCEGNVKVLRSDRWTTLECELGRLPGLRANRFRQTSRRPSSARAATAPGSSVAAQHQAEVALWPPGSRTR